MSPNGLKPCQTNQPSCLKGQETVFDNPVFLILTMTALPLVLGLLAHMAF